MGTEPVETGRYKDRPRQQWDLVAAGWEKWWRTIESGAQHVSNRLLDMAEVKPGQRVLDIATGIGEPALLAARRVGAAGGVVATDFSTRMLDIARERATTLGLTNVEFIEADAERLDFPDGSFDAILCRWGLESLSNPSNALAEIRRMLAPNGSFATSVWDVAPKPPVTSVATALAREMFHSPSPQPETPSRPGLTEGALERTMTHVGYADVRAEKMAVILEFPTIEAFTRYLMDVSPELAALLSDQPSDRQEEYLQRLAEEVRQHVTIDGNVRVQSITICAVGRR
jgi:ubiquinone/menaquinone biosynthesis C-methylase UbiE